MASTLWILISLQLMPQGSEQLMFIYFYPKRCWFNATFVVKSVLFCFFCFFLLKFLLFLFCLFFLRDAFWNSRLVASKSLRSIKQAFFFCFFSFFFSFFFFLSLDDDELEDESFPSAFLQFEHNWTRCYFTLKSATRVGFIGARSQMNRFCCPLEVSLQCSFHNTCVMSWQWTYCLANLNGNCDSMILFLSELLYPMSHVLENKPSRLMES